VPLGIVAAAGDFGPTLCQPSLNLRITATLSLLMLRSITIRSNIGTISLIRRSGRRHPKSFRFQPEAPSSIAAEFATGKPNRLSAHVNAELLDVPTSRPPSASFNLRVVAPPLTDPIRGRWQTSDDADQPV
jgi:hypothetical protein